MGANKEAPKKETAPATVPAVTEQMALSARFTGKVMEQFGKNVSGAIQVSDYQRQLIQGYFIGIDRGLKVAEEARLRKNTGNTDHKYDNPLPVIWANVNLDDLAMDVIHYARMGLDMMSSNHLNPIPFRNKKTGKYDIDLMEGYSGIQYIAEKYALDKPLSVTIELVYSTDTFIPLKKDQKNKVEGYDFKINNAFDRGNIIGGFGYIEFTDPLKNKLIIMTMKDIEKRKPRYAAAEFWGGTKTEWKDGKKTEVQCAGWQEEMFKKTIIREVYSPANILLDPKKVDDDYQYAKMREKSRAEMVAAAEIGENANHDVIDTTPDAKALPDPAQKKAEDPAPKKDEPEEGEPQQEEFREPGY